MAPKKRKKESKVDENAEAAMGRRQQKKLNIEQILVYGARV